MESCDIDAKEAFRDDYFSRQIRLMGKERMEILRTKKVAIIGSGGLGCSLGIALAGSGVGELHLVDFDTVSLSNIHRQIAFKISDVGRLKCDSLRDLLKDRGETEILSFNENLSEYFARNFDIDLIVDATDNLPARAKLDEIAKNRALPWLYASVEAWHGQVCLIEKGDFSGFKISERQPEGVATPMVMQIASIAGNLALRYLSGLVVKRDYLYYCAFNSEGALQLSAYGIVQRE
ncbi:MAG: HesA/MoeB/ThiF family protein [Wolinella sp.]